MTRDETRHLLLIRRELTGEPFNDGTIDAWHRALAHDRVVDVRTALDRAAREHHRVTIAHIAERLPSRAPNTAPTGPAIDPHCTICGDTGLDMSLGGHGNACPCWWTGNTTSEPNSRTTVTRTRAERAPNASPTRAQLAPSASPSAGPGITDE